MYLQDQSRGRINYKAIAAAVAAAATAEGAAVPSIISLAFGDCDTVGGSSATTLNLSKSLEVEEHALPNGGRSRDDGLGDGRTGEEEGRRSPRDRSVRVQRPNQLHRARPTTRAGCIASDDGGTATDAVKEGGGGGEGGRKVGAHASWTDRNRALSPPLFASIGSALSFPYSAGSATRLEASVTEVESSGSEDNNDGVSQHGKEPFDETRQGTVIGRFVPMNTSARHCFRHHALTSMPRGATTASSPTVACSMPHQKPIWETLYGTYVRATSMQAKPHGPGM